MSRCGLSGSEKIVRGALCRSSGMSSPVEINASWRASPLRSMLKSPRAMRLWSQPFMSLVHPASHSAMALSSGTRFSSFSP